MINPERTSSPTSRSFWQINLHLAPQVATSCSNSGDAFRSFSPTATKTGFSTLKTFENPSLSLRIKGTYKENKDNTIGFRTAMTGTELHLSPRSCETLQ